MAPERPIVVFNPLSWQRTDAVEVETPFPGESPYVKITDSAGKAYPARALGDTLYFTARDVPPLGYRVYWASRAPQPVPTAIKCTADAVENQFFRVTVDKKAAAITGIYDKTSPPPANAYRRESRCAGACARVQSAGDERRWHDCDDGQRPCQRACWSWTAAWTSSRSRSV